MCGASTFFNSCDWLLRDSATTSGTPSTAGTPTATTCGGSSRRLLRNISSNSSSIANNDDSCLTPAAAAAATTTSAAAAAAVAAADAECMANNPNNGSSGCDDTAVIQDDRAVLSSLDWFHRHQQHHQQCHHFSTSGCTSTSTPSCSFDSTQPHVHAMHHQQPCMQADAHEQPHMLLIGTSAGLYQLDLSSMQIHQLALAGLPVAYVSYSSCGLVLAACPEPEEGSAESKEAAGLYCLNFKHDSSSSTCGSNTGLSTQQGFSSRAVPAMKLWQGGATCCVFAPSDAGCEALQAAVPRIYLGTQPANLMYSDDLGGSWASCDLSGAPQADNWYRRLPPYEPSVRAINFSSSSSSSAGGGAVPAPAADGVVQQQQQGSLLVAVEVGGVLSTPQQQHQETEHDQDMGHSWTDCSQSLCRDVHALQADPFNPRVLFAVAGSGQLPGGLYRCKGKAQKWKRLFGYRYSVGMALSAYQKGRMVLVSADKPPATGCILFESTDSGRSWVNISDDVADAAAALTEHSTEVFEQAPLTMFVPGGLVVCCASGHIFHGTAKPLGGYSNWSLVATLPSAVNCMCSTDVAAAPVAIQRH